MEKSNYERLKKACENYLAAEDRYSCMVAGCSNQNQSELSDVENERDAYNDILVQTVVDILADEMPE